MRLSAKTSKTFLPLVLTSAIAAAITGCNGGSSDGDDTAAKDTVEVRSTSTFSAIYMGQVDHNAEHQASAPDAERSPQAVTYFEGTLTAVDTATNQPQAFDWPLVLGEDGMVASQKTVTLEPGTYDFTLVVNRGSQQYTAVLLQYQIDDQGEYRLDFQLDPVAGDTIVDFDNVKLMSRLQLKYPADELNAIDAPQIGLIVDGVETIYQLNKETGMADITLNYQEGSHSYDVNLYNGDKLIGRSAVGTQNIDLAQGTDFTLDLISLQADVTVDVSNLSEPNFIFNIPQEIIDHVGDAANVNLMARITDNENVQEVTLPVELVDGKYQAIHTFGPIEEGQVAAYIEFLDISGTETSVVSTCADSINVSQPNNLNCDVEISKDYVIGGNLLATLSVNVLDQDKVAQAGAKVYVDGELVGVTGNNFGTSGFVKTHVRAGSEYLVRGEKNGLEDTHTLTPGTLSINNFDLILATPVTPIEGITCKTILESGNSTGSGIYTLDADGDGPLDSFETYCDMETKEGGWTLVQNRSDNIELPITYNLTGPIVVEGSIERISGVDGAVSDGTWNALKSNATELLVISGVPGDNAVRFYTTVDKINSLSSFACVSWDDAVSLTMNKLLHYEQSGCTNGGIDYSFIGQYHDGHNVADTYNNFPDFWLESTSRTNQADGTAIYIR